MQTRPLHRDFGVEVTGVDVATVISDNLYPEIRALFEAHSLLLFRNQQLDDSAHMRFGALFGKQEDRRKPQDQTGPEVSPITNKDSGDHIIDEHDLHVLQLKANQLWHTDSTFLPVPALANVLTAHVVPSSGGETQFVSTRAAFKRLPADEQDRLRKTYITHRYAHSRAQISDDLSKQELFTMWCDQHWRAVWTNPANGEDALYIASHGCAIDGLPDDEAQAYLARLIEDATQAEHVYNHDWSPGDVIIWDERATMHRGCPWPYDEERTMASICVSVGPNDGLDSVR
ncbi:MAG: TauD/TfdA family dioxygenase [Rhizobiales bacterium]|nr:TauD/TfdA family dioxygenase [Hyphomicrobiales bacterium]